ncbi:hypothetical protein GCM10012282_80910 [Streptomyces lacrimifluminis]|uniref:Uncharacterized protein n=1 Tax=Streptomyces lacrimifluminis TaxID=1500077 RepID=A0A917UP69_9ACTN|nr:hypothetical protein GCM10012282_80910 [Streptomyces lacrimifluminis]
MSNRDEADTDNQERWGAQVPADQYQDRPCSPESGLPYLPLEPSTGHTAEQQSVHPDDGQDDGEGDQHKAQHKEREQIPSPCFRLARRIAIQPGCRGDLTAGAGVTFDGGAWYQQRPVAAGPAPRAVRRVTSPASAAPACQFQHSRDSAG